MQVDASFPLDSVVAGAVLVALIVTLSICTSRIWQSREAWLSARPAGLAGRNWLLAALLAAGVGIAGYLSFTSLTHTELACGPLGGCNVVQNSRYAHLLGIPVGLWGVGGYFFMLLCWALGVWGRGNGLTRYARPGILILSLAAVAFSTYLTTLELFVIRATCTWCVGSAVVTAAVCWTLMRDKAWLPTEVTVRPRRRRKIKRK